MPSCQNPTTLGDLKKGDGFNGFVVPDFGFAVRDPRRPRTGRRRPAGASGRRRRRLDRRGLHLGPDPGVASGRHGPPDPVRDLRLRACSTTRCPRRPRPRSRRRRTSRWRPRSRRRARCCSRTTAACCRCPGTSPLDRADRPDRRRRGVRDRRLGGRPARSRAGDHAARRDHRPRRRGRRERHPGAGLGRRRGLADARRLVGADAEQRPGRACSGSTGPTATSAGLRR